MKIETIETHARAFLPLNISAVGSVACLHSNGNQALEKKIMGENILNIDFIWPKM